MPGLQSHSWRWFGMKVVSVFSGDSNMPRGYMETTAELYLFLWHQESQPRARWWEETNSQSTIDLVFFHVRVLSACGNWNLCVASRKMHAIGHTVIWLVMSTFQESGHPGIVMSPVLSSLVKGLVSQTIWALTGDTFAWNLLLKFTNWNSMHGRIPGSRRMPRIL